MTKREFFENVLKMKPSEIGTAVPFNTNGETEVTEEWLISFIKNLLAERNNWHTGTPTKEGNYIAHLRIKSRDGELIEYDMTCNLEVLLNYIMCQDESEENYLMIKGWMMYEPYEGKK